MSQDPIKQLQSVLEQKSGAALDYDKVKKKALDNPSWAASVYEKAADDFKDYASKDDFVKAIGTAGLTSGLSKPLDVPETPTPLTSTGKTVAEDKKRAKAELAQKQAKEKENVAAGRHKDGSYMGAPFPGEEAMSKVADFFLFGKSDQPIPQAAREVQDPEMYIQALGLQEQSDMAKRAEKSLRKATEKYGANVSELIDRALAGDKTLTKEELKVLETAQQDKDIQTLLQAKEAGIDVSKTQQYKDNYDLFAINNAKNLPAELQSPLTYAGVKGSAQIKEIRTLASARIKLDSLPEDKRRTLLTPGQGTYVTRQIAEELGVSIKDARELAKMPRQYMSYLGEKVAYDEWFRDLGQVSEELATNLKSKYGSDIFEKLNTADPSKLSPADRAAYQKVVEDADFMRLQQIGRSFEGRKKDYMDLMDKYPEVKQRYMEGKRSQRAADAVVKDYPFLSRFTELNVKLGSGMFINTAEFLLPPSKAAEYEKLMNDKLGIPTRTGSIWNKAGMVTSTRVDKPFRSNVATQGGLEYHYSNEGEFIGAWDAKTNLRVDVFADPELFDKAVKQTNWYSGVAMGVEVMGDVVITGLLTAGIGSGLATLTKAGKLSNAGYKLSSVIASYTQYQNRWIQDGMKNGMSFDDASNYSSMVSGAIAMLQPIYGFEAGLAKSIVGDMWKGMTKAEIKKFVSNPHLFWAKAGKVLKDTIGETFEEGLEQLLEFKVNAAANQMYGSSLEEGFGSMADAKDSAMEIAFVTMIGTGPMSAVKSISDHSAKSKWMREYLLSAAVNPEMYTQLVEELRKEGQLNNSVDYMEAELAAIGNQYKEELQGDKLSVEQKQDLVVLGLQEMELRSALDRSPDPAGQEAQDLTKRYEEVQKKLADLAEGKVPRRKEKPEPAPEPEPEVAQDGPKVRKGWKQEGDVKEVDGKQVRAISTEQKGKKTVEFQEVRGKNAKSIAVPLSETPYSSSRPTEADVQTLEEGQTFGNVVNVSQEGKTTTATMEVVQDGKVVGTQEVTLEKTVEPSGDAEFDALREEVLSTTPSTPPQTVSTPVAPVSTPPQTASTPPTTAAPKTKKPTNTPLAKAAQRASKVLKALGANINFEIHATREDMRKATGHGDVHYNEATGTIHLNEEVDSSRSIHEAWHPILNQLRKNNEKVYNRLVSYMNSELKKNPYLNKKIGEFVGRYAQAGKSKPEQTDEGLTEFLTQVSSNPKLLTANGKKSLVKAIQATFNKFRDWFVATDSRPVDQMTDSEIMEVIRGAARAFAGDEKAVDAIKKLFPPATLSDFETDPTELLKKSGWAIVSDGRGLKKQYGDNYRKISMDGKVMHLVVGVQDYNSLKGTVYTPFGKYEASTNLFYSYAGKVVQGQGGFKVGTTVFSIPTKGYQVGKQFSLGQVATGGKIRVDGTTIANISRPEKLSTILEDRNLFPNNAIWNTLRSRKDLPTYNNTEVRRANISARNMYDETDGIFISGEDGPSIRRNPIVIVDSSFTGSEYRRLLQHEVIHAYTFGVISLHMEGKQNLLSDKERKFTSDIERMYAMYNKSSAEYYGLSDLHEFVTEGLTSPDFKRFLDKISWTTSRVVERERTVRTEEKLTLLDKFLNSLFELFGLEYKPKYKEEVIKEKETVRTKKPGSDTLETLFIGFISNRTTKTWRGDEGSLYFSLEPLEGAPQAEGAAGPDPGLVAVAEKYARDNGIPYKRQGKYVKVSVERAKRLAAAYEAMRHAPNDPKVKEAYEELIKQTRKQYDALVEAGYEFSFFDGNTDPYKGNPMDAMRDLRNNKKMAVYGTYDGYGTGSELNIGLDSPTGGPQLTQKQVIEAVKKVGGEVVESKIHTSDTEPTLVIKLKTKLDDNVATQLSEALGQEAIAQRLDDETGKLFGPQAENWGDFNPDFFITLDGKRASEVSNPMLEDTGLQWPDQNGEMRKVTANDLFRAVHDAFGHGLEGAGFRSRGEENAWQAHVRLFTGLAIGAITSETRGQNSWLNYGPYGDTNRTAKLEDTVFAEQKTGLMPEWTWTEGLAPDAEEGIHFSLTQESADEIANGVGSRVVPGKVFSTWREDKFEETISVESVSRRKPDALASATAKMAINPLLGIPILKEFLQNAENLSKAKKADLLAITKKDIKNKIDSLTNKKTHGLLDKIERLKSLKKGTKDYKKLNSSIEKLKVSLSELKEVARAKSLEEVVSAIEAMTDDSMSAVVLSQIATSKKFTQVRGNNTFVQKTKEELRSDAENLIDTIKGKIKENLRALYEAISPEIRSISKLWYDGANIIANTFAKEYGVSLEQSAAIIAILSPQKDWFANVHVAQAAMSILSNPNLVFTEAHLEKYIQNAKNYEGQKKDIPQIRSAVGKKISELSDKQAAVLIRSEFELNMNRVAPVRLPNGEVVSTGDALASFNDYKSLGSVVSVYRDGSDKNINKRIGTQNKVRNFYVNIADPNNPDAVTIDTHAYAAAFMFPFAASSKEVVFQPSEYAIVAEAYRELAQEYGILPREMQSITWEAVRVLFPKEEKKGKKAHKEVNEVLSKRDNGKITEDEARQQITGRKDLNQTSWSEFAGELRTERENDGEETSRIFGLLGNRDSDRQGDVSGTVGNMPSTRGLDPVSGGDGGGRRFSLEASSIAEQAKADGTYLKAPNGKDTNLTEEQWATVRTQAFKDWFGDWENDPENASKVVDENGEPLVMYHATDSDEFFEFDPDKIGSNAGVNYGKGFYFESSPQEAKWYTGGKGRIIEVFLNSKTPAPYHGTTRNMQKRADGIYISANFDGDFAGEGQFMVKLPNQIKSATDNVGTFSSENPDIRFSLSNPRDYTAAKAIDADAQTVYIATGVHEGGFDAVPQDLSIQNWTTVDGENKSAEGKAYEVLMYPSMFEAFPQFANANVQIEVGQELTEAEQGPYTGNLTLSAPTEQQLLEQVASAFRGYAQHELGFRRGTPETALKSLDLPTESDRMAVYEIAASGDAGFAAQFSLSDQVSSFAQAYTDALVQGHSLQTATEAGIQNATAGEFNLPDQRIQFSLPPKSDLQEFIAERKDRFIALLQKGTKEQKEQIVKDLARREGVPETHVLAAFANEGMLWPFAGYKLSQVPLRRMETTGTPIAPEDFQQQQNLQAGQAQADEYIFQVLDMYGADAVDTLFEEAAQHRANTDTDAMPMSTYILQSIIMWAQQNGNFEVEDRGWKEYRRVGTQDGRNMAARRAFVTGNHIRSLYHTINEAVIALLPQSIKDAVKRRTITAEVAQDAANLRRDAVATEVELKGAFAAAAQAESKFSKTPTIIKKVANFISEAFRGYVQKSIDTAGGFAGAMVSGNPQQSVARMLLALTDSHTSAQAVYLTLKGIQKANEEAGFFTGTEQEVNSQIIEFFNEVLNEKVKGVEARNQLNLNTPYKVDLAKAKQIFDPKITAEAELKRLVEYVYSRNNNGKRLSEAILNSPVLGYLGHAEARAIEKAVSEHMKQTYGERVKREVEKYIKDEKYAEYYGERKTEFEKRSRSVVEKIADAAQYGLLDDADFQSYLATMFFGSKLHLDVLVKIKELAERRAKTTSTLIHREIDKEASWLVYRIHPATMSKYAVDFFSYVIRGMLSGMKTIWYSATLAGLVVNVPKITARSLYRAVQWATVDKMGGPHPFSFISDFVQSGLMKEMFYEIFPKVLRSDADADHMQAFIGDPDINTMGGVPVQNRVERLTTKGLDVIAEAWKDLKKDPKKFAAYMRLMGDTAGLVLTAPLRVTTFLKSFDQLVSAISIPYYAYVEAIEAGRKEGLKGDALLEYAQRKSGFGNVYSAHVIATEKLIDASRREGNKHMFVVDGNGNVVYETKTLTDPLGNKTDYQVPKTRFRYKDLFGSMLRDAMRESADQEFIGIGEYLYKDAQMMGQPEGVVGVGIMNKLRGLKPPMLADITADRHRFSVGKMFTNVIGHSLMPFGRIVAQSLSVMYRYSLMGAMEASIRLATGKNSTYVGERIGERIPPRFGKANIDGKIDRRIRSTQETAEQIILTTVTHMMAVMGMAAAMFDWDDDEGLTLKEDRNMDVTFQRTGNYQKDKLSDPTEKRLSISAKGSDWVSYRYAMTAIPAYAPIGILRDKLVYGGEVDNMDILLAMTTGPFQAILDQTFAQSIQTMLKFGQEIHEAVNNPEMNDENLNIAGAAAEFVLIQLYGSNLGMLASGGNLTRDISADVLLAPQKEDYFSYSDVKTGTRSRASKYDNKFFAKVFGNTHMFGTSSVFVTGGKLMDSWGNPIPREYVAKEGAQLVVDGLLSSGPIPFAGQVAGIEAPSLTSKAAEYANLPEIKLTSKYKRVMAPKVYYPPKTLSDAEKIVNLDPEKAEPIVENGKEVSAEVVRDRILRMREAMTINVGHVMREYIRKNYDQMDKFSEEELALAFEILRKEAISLVKSQAEFFGSGPFEALVVNEVLEPEMIKRQIDADMKARFFQQPSAEQEAKVVRPPLK